MDPKLIGKAGDPGPVKDGAFIHIIRHAEQYLALWESGPAYEVTEQLKTMGEWHPKGSQTPFNMNAHTRLDPNTGALFAFTYDFQPPYLRYYIINKEGELTQNTPIEKPYSSMMHDFVLTENYVVFFDCPAVFDLKRMMKGEGLLQWQPELGVRIGVIDRRTQKTFWIETEPFFVFHFANGYEQDQKIIIDHVRHKNFVLGDYAENIPPQLYRSIIDLNLKTVIHQQLDNRMVEFPRINEHFISKKNRYIYLPSKIDSDEFNALIKYDLEKNSTTIHHFGKETEIGEAVFAPNSSGDSEDDGYMMLFVYNKNENKSDLVILHGQDFAGEPAARIKLSCRVPNGLHGSWMPDSEKWINKNQTKSNEIEPPWIKRPDTLPGDFYWRDAGEAWFDYVWLPYWKSLSESEKHAYLQRWHVPDDWRFYSAQINPEFREKMESLDKS